MTKIWCTAWATVGASMALALLAAAPASALEVRWYNDVTDYFSGSGCHDTSRVTIPVPRDAYAVTVVRPAVGMKLTDDSTGQTDATITSIRRRGDAYDFTATGSDDVCANPNRYAQTGWQTTAVSFEVDYKTQEGTFYPSACNNPTFRPKRIVIACGSGNFYIDHISWGSWGDQSARGVGTAHVKDCTHSCAKGHFHAYPGVTVSLDRVHYCKSNGDFEFTRLRYRYTRGKPARASATGSKTAGCAAAR